MADIGAPDLRRECAVGSGDQIGDLVLVDHRLFGGIDRHVGGADRGVSIEPRHREDDASVGLLKDIGVLAVVQPIDDGMAALDEA